MAVEVNRLRTYVTAGNPVNFKTIRREASQELSLNVPESQLVVSLDGIGELFRLLVNAWRMPVNAPELARGVADTRSDAVSTMEVVADLLVRLEATLKPTEEIRRRARQEMAELAALPAAPYEVHIHIRHAGEALRHIANSAAP